MLFKNVSIAGLAHIDAPHTLTTKEINERLQPTLDRLGIRTDVLGDIAGIHARRLWDPGTQASDAATMAGRKALEDAGVSPDRIGLLVNTSVSRDYLEPSTASIVSGNLGVGDECQTFDVANACLAFINGMDIAARMIEHGDIDYALVVDGETANLGVQAALLAAAQVDHRVADLREPQRLFLALLVHLRLGAAVVGKIAAGFVAGKGMNPWLVGWGMVPRGEVGLIFAMVGKQLGVTVDKRKMSMADIKNFGTYTAEVKLYNGIIAKLYVEVGE